MSNIVIRVVVIVGEDYSLKKRTILSYVTVLPPDLGIGVVTPGLGLFNAGIAAKVLGALHFGGRCWAAVDCAGAAVERPNVDTEGHLWSR